MGAGLGLGHTYQLALLFLVSAGMKSSLQGVGASGYRGLVEGDWLLQQASSYREASCHRGTGWGETLVIMVFLFPLLAADCCKPLLHVL